MAKVGKQQHRNVDQGSLSGPAPINYFDVAVFAFYICVLVLRATYAENAEASVFNPALFLPGPVMSFLNTSALVLVSLLWFAAAALRGRALRFAGVLGWGAVIFTAAVIVSVTGASDKRAAINNGLTIIAPIIAAVVLVNILTLSRVRVLLWVVLGLGVVSFTECVQQHLESNEQMIEMYEQDPSSQLQSLGIEKGTLEHMMYEHRLYSRDIRGFLTTGNSTASLFLLCIFSAGGLAVLHYSRHRARRSAGLYIPAGFVVLLACGLLLTKSKGGTGGFIIGAALAVAAVGFRGFFIKRSMWIIAAGAIGLTLLAAMVIYYGVEHGTLPGGNSMLVRGQYWHAAWDMFCDHPLRGVGGGNFGIFYPLYKNAAAPETVKNPHNFLLSLLSQFGPLGTAGFLTAALGGAYTGLFTKTHFQDPSQNAGCKVSSRLVRTLMVFSIIVFLLLRPFYYPIEGINSLLVFIYIALTIYILPCCVFLLCFWVLFKFCSLKTCAGDDTAGWDKPRAVISAGLAAVLIHNLVDFAIFEPAVLTVFWMLCAVIIYLGKPRSGDAVAGGFSQRPKGRGPVFAAATAGFMAVLFLATIPTLRTGYIVQQVMKGRISPDTLCGEDFLHDHFDSRPCEVKGKILLQTYQSGIFRDEAILLDAAAAFEKAVLLNPAEFKNYRSLYETYRLLAEMDKSGGDIFLNKAFENAKKAAERYPGSGRLHYELALTAEQLKMPGTAAVHYQKAVEIEDAYRRQFREMYPDIELYSRLGFDKYETAKHKIATLSQSAK